MANPTFIGSAVATAINGGTATVTLPAGMQQDDIVVVFHGIPGNVVPAAAPSGYTSITTATPGGVAASAMRASYKFMGAIPDTTVACAGTGSAQDVTCAEVKVWRGVDTTTPLDVAATTATGTTGAPDPAPITPTSADCAIVIGAVSSVDDSTPGTVTNYTSPTPSTANATDTNPATVAAAYRLLSGGAGASENPGAWSSWTTSKWAAITIALRPGSGGIQSGALAAAGLGAATFVGASIAAAVLSSSGAGAFTGVGRSTAEAVLSAAGVGAFNATGRAIVPAALLAAGVGTFTGASASINGGVLSAVGVGGFAGVGASTAATVFQAVGAGAFSGAGRSTAAAVLAAAGVGTLNAVTGTNRFQMSGVGTATFVGRSIASAVFSSSGAGVYQAAGNAGVLPFSFGFVID